MKKSAQVFAIALAVVSTALFTNRFQDAYALPDDQALNTLDAKGLRQGHWVITANMAHQVGYAQANSAVQEGNYIDDKREGVWIMYYPSGNKSAELTFRNNQLNGEAKRFSENGVVIAETNYFNGFPKGVEKKYYPDGKLWTEFTWSEGRIKGEAATYYPNGKLCEIGNWVYAGWSGEYKLYYDNGNLYKSESKPLVY